MLIRLRSLFTLSVLLWLGACRPDSATQGAQKGESVTAPAGALEPTPTPPGVHLSKDTAADIALVLDGSGQLCADLLQWSRRPVHLVCDAGPADPEGRALQAGLTDLRRQVAQPLSRRKVILLAGPDRVADVRALMGRDPGFFSRAAVWTEGDRTLIDLFGPTFLGGVAQGGAKVLLLLGAEEKEYRPWIRSARRAGLELAVGERALQVRAALARLLRSPEPEADGPPPEPAEEQRSR